MNRSPLAGEDAPHVAGDPVGLPVGPRGDRLSLRLRSVHVGGTMVDIDPAALPHRLHEAGLVDVRIDLGPRSFRFRASRPPARF